MKATYVGLCKDTCMIMLNKGKEGRLWVQRVTQAACHSLSTFG
jgi:hypothetical protein